MKKMDAKKMKKVVGGDVYCVNCGRYMSGLWDLFTHRFFYQNHKVYLGW